MPSLSNSDLAEELDDEQGVEDVYYQVVNHSLDTSKNNPEVTLDLKEVTITCSDKVNGNGIETMKVWKKMVTNIKEEDEVYVPIVKDQC